MHVYFVGVGGIGMSGLARILLESGYKVSGSDLRKTEIIRRLCEEGMTFYSGHKKEHVKGKDLVIFSSAIKQDNPEIIQAKLEGIPLISRGRFVAEIANLKKSIVIAGTHGKTTTTALISELLLDAEKDPTILVGGVLKRIDSNSRFGRGEWMIVESDESDGSFLFHHPDIAVITNIEKDHLDFYHSFQNILQAFSKFIDRIKPEGAGIFNLDDPALFYLLTTKKKRKGKILTYGLSSKADIWAKNIDLKPLQASFEVMFKKNLLGKVEVPLAGFHNVYNCLAVIGVGIFLGIDWKKIKKALFHFEGIKRRLEKVGEMGKIPVFDDYAHHPTEIKAVLKELKRLKRRIIAIFQPHRYTRTKLLLSEFAPAFDEADVLVLLPIYPAGELPISGIDGKSFFEHVKKKRKLPTYFFSSKKDVINFIRENLKRNDLIVTVGAGDVTYLSQEILSSKFTLEE